MAQTFDHLVPDAPAGRFDGIERAYTARRRGAAARLRADRATRSPSAAPTGCGSCCSRSPTSMRSAP